MRKAVTIVVTLAAAVTLWGGMGQAGGPEDYKAKCAMCHGDDGKKLTKADLSNKAVTADACKAAVTNGKGAMKAVAGVDAAAICQHVASLQK